MNTAKWIRELIEDNKLYKFYKCKEWISVKAKVLKEHHNECAWCKERGRIRKAVEVHHVQFVKRHPELALKEFYTYNGKQYRNLVPLCHDCHDKAHERMKYKPKPEPLTKEKW